MGHLTSHELESQVGHPETLRDALFARVQEGAVKRFSEVQERWIELM